MRVWRICRKTHSTDTLTGRGGLFASGRWHSRGRPIVYASGSLSLAALEVLVHVDRTSAPADLVQVEIEVPDGLRVSRIAVRTLPRGWRSYPAPADLQRRGDDWLSKGATPVLEVPSALIPEESNFLLNPGHVDAGAFKAISSRAFAFDARLAP
ncbi:MAG: RES family NAD+ phosphorylase [bacterium]|nr:RES family NAD+ phosphorylase [bacterium]